MRKEHIIGGLIVFSVGLFFCYMNLVYVVQFLKGMLQPLFIVIGITAAIAAVLGNRKLRSINMGLAAIFLVLGFYGLYDEYYNVMDFFSGLLPPVLILVGLISAVHGIRKLA
jgi:hypothetical protein